MLSQLGIYGYDQLAHVILGGLASGEPILFVGGHGTAKTTLCRRLAEGLGMRFWAYDASKAMFEDIVGFPNPASLSSGVLDYVPTPISIWDKQFVLIDELSRANPATQNKWMEVIRSRQIMGCHLPELRYVVAAMNPPSYAGAYPLDEALAGRFALVIAVPDVRNMDAEDVRKIMLNVTEDDRPGEASHTLPDGALQGIIGDIRQQMQSLDESSRNRLQAYVLALYNALQDADQSVDGRRLGMMYRSLTACAAAAQVLQIASAAEMIMQERPMLALLDALRPIHATETNNSTTVLHTAHHLALRKLDSTHSVRAQRRLGKLAMALDTLEIWDKLQPLERREAITRSIETSRTASDLTDAAQAATGIHAMAIAVASGTRRPMADDQYRILNRYRQIHEGAEGLGAEFRKNLNSLKRENGETPDITTTSGLIALRSACHLMDARGNEDDAARRKLAQIMHSTLTTYLSPTED